MQNKISIINYACYVFDWDGTIFDSKDLKKRSFVNSLKHTIKNMGIILSEDLLKSSFEKFTGLPRQEVVRGMLKSHNINLSDLNFEDISKLITKEFYISAYSANIYEDALAILNKLIAKEKIIYISSSSPQNELENISQKMLPIELIKCINGIYGSRKGFSKGINHIEHIMKKEKLSKKQIIMIGDDKNDLDLAGAAGVDFLGINRFLERKKENSDKWINSLIELE